MEQQISKTEIDTSRSKRDTINFFLSGLVWSVLYLLIQLIVWLVKKDFTVSLSLCGKIGIGMIAFSLIILGGKDKLAAATASRYVATGSKSSHDDSVATAEREASKESFLLIVIAPIGVWMLLWGLIFLIPYAFGIPFIIR